MLKSRALQRKRIAFYLAVMLMFCAFCADGAAAGEVTCFAGVRQQKMLLGQPGAGEFFTGSLPDGERQSVREASGEWQIVLSVRSSRANGFRNSPKGTGAYIVQSSGLHTLSVTGEISAGENGLPITPCREVIVCYIQKQDGAKG